MDKTIYTFDEVRDIIKEQKYNFCSLFDLEGNSVVAYNSIRGQQKSLPKKLEEIERRLTRIPDGVYYVMCKEVYGKYARGEKMYIGVGKYDASVLNSQPDNTNKKLSEDKPIMRSEKLLSIETAMENMRELSDVKAENARLTEENRQLKAIIAEMEEEEPEEEESSLKETTNGLADMFKNLMPIIEPLAQKHYALKEQALNMQKVKFLHENGYEIPGIRKASGNPRPKREERPSNEPKEIPRPGATGWAEYIHAVVRMDEDTFNQHMKQLEEHDTELYEAVCKEVYNEEEEEEEGNES